MLFFGIRGSDPYVEGANLEGAILEDLFGTTPEDLHRISNQPVPPITNHTTNHTTNHQNVIPWTQNADCVGQEDPVTMDTIPDGHGFRLEAENRCYDALALAEMRRLNRPMVGPMTRIPFTPNDIQRIDAFRTANPTLRVNGGKKRRTRRKIRKIRKNRRKTMRGKRINTNKRRNTKRGKKN